MQPTVLDWIMYLYGLSLKYPVVESFIGKTLGGIKHQSQAYLV